jgi:DsbC/DsbD-like thiol-disulfide interchange protein
MWCGTATCKGRGIILSRQRDFLLRGLCPKTAVMRQSILVITLLCAGLARAVHAGPPDDVVTVDILPGWETGHGTHMAGIRFTLAPGWKTYWRAPGDAGIPPAFNWQGSENIEAARFHWPVPEVFHTNGMQSIGYSGQVVIPVELTPSRPGEAARIAGSVEFGVCDDICVPVHVSFDQILVPGGDRDVAIATALVDRPLTEEEAGVGGVTCQIEPSDDGLWVTALLDMPSAGDSEVVVIEAGDPRVWVSEAETSRTGNALSARVQMIHVSGSSFALDRSAVRITVLGSQQAVDISGCTAG